MLVYQRVPIVNTNIYQHVLTTPTSISTLSNPIWSICLFQVGISLSQVTFDFQWQKKNRQVVRSLQSLGNGSKIWGPQMYHYWDLLGHTVALATKFTDSHVLVGSLCLLVKSEFLKTLPFPLFKRPSPNLCCLLWSLIKQVSLYTVVPMISHDHPPFCWLPSGKLT